VSGVPWSAQLWCLVPSVHHVSGDVRSPACLCTLWGGCVLCKVVTTHGVMQRSVLEQCTRASGMLAGCSCFTPTNCFEQKHVTVCTTEVC